jgi:divalent metal cation (Fe/Co/Zn/Cd) transporter
MPAEDLARVTAVLDSLRTDEVDFVEVRTVESGRHRFVTLTVLVPGSWTVDRGHTLADDVELAISKDLPHTDVQTHLEPRQPS